MKYLYLLLMPTLFLTGQAARADWQYTKWGMAPAQVQKASKGTAVLTDGMAVAGEKIKLTAPYASGTFKFTANFWFDENDKLTEVDLNLNEGDPNELVSALKGKYGEPVNEMPGLLHAWRWVNGADKVALMTTPAKASVSYSPRVTANGKGL